MKILSDGSPNTLGRWIEMSLVMFGEDSKPVSFLRGKVAESPNGLNEEVVADERQMLFLLVKMADAGG